MKTTNYFLAIGLMMSPIASFGQESQTPVQAQTQVLNQPKIISENNPTQNEKFKFNVTGRAYLDGTVFFDSPIKLGSGATISDIRIGVNGSYQKFNGKIDIGFAKKAISLKDLFIAYNFQPNSYIRAGHFAEPLGLDYMESSATIKFIGPGCVTEAFAPGRKLGLEYIGWSGSFWYAGGIFGDTHFQERVNYAVNDGYAFTGRLVYNPLKDYGQILHFGAASTYRKPDMKTNGGQRDVTFGATLGSAINSTQFVRVTVPDANYTFKAVGEFITAWGPFFIQSEYFFTKTIRTNHLTPYKAWGVYAQTGFLIGCQDYKYAKQWARLALPSPGALEFVGRFSYLDLNNPESKLYGGKQWQISAACNYYWKKFITLRLNYEYATLGPHSLNGIDHFSFVSGRIQFYF